jgi:hypothetical protein
MKKYHLTNIGLVEVAVEEHDRIYVYNQRLKKRIKELYNFVKLDGKVLSWEPNLKVRFMGERCQMCGLFVDTSEVPEKLLSGFCEDCTYPELWSKFMN